MLQLIPRLQAMLDDMGMIDEKTYDDGSMKRRFLDKEVDG